MCALRAVLGRAGSLPRTARECNATPVTLAVSAVCTLNRSALAAGTASTCRITLVRPVQPAATPAPQVPLTALAVSPGFTATTAHALSVPLAAIPAMQAANAPSVWTPTSFQAPLVRCVSAHARTAPLWQIALPVSTPFM